MPPTNTSPLLSFKDHNLVFVSFDALQAAHVGCLGYERNVTPTIDSLAARGFNFRNNISVSSWTVPASMTWFTGVFPSEHRMTNKYAVFQPPVTKIANLKELSPDLITLADILKQNGYATGGFTGNAGVSGGFGYEQGFDKYYYEKGKFGRMDQSIQQALVWLKANRNKKFFLFLHGYDVHGQSTPSGGFDYRFVDKDYNRRFTGAELEQEVLREEGLEKGQLSMRGADVRFWRAVYDEKIQRTDEAFQRFLAEFDKLGLSEKTIFVLTSDHGTELYEHRRFDHGFTLYQELIRVPLIIKLPGRTASRKIDERVSSVDVMPTVLELLDVKLTDKTKRQLRGTSLVAAMQGSPMRKDIFSETDYREYTYKRSIISPDGWKLIYTLENRTRELYDLAADAGETMNLAASHSGTADELERRLFAHFKSIGHDLNGRRWKVGLNPVYPSQGQASP
ncbi:MAG: sulfatase [Planctomycetota bacterium]|nr:sulfatase [Planctomycetota bacterium]